MLKKRIIPCLDIKEGRTVKGVNFIDLHDAGDPVELAQRYVEQRADELVFLDITSTVERHGILTGLVRRIASEINLPFTVGGGIESAGDVGDLLDAGADKVSINSSAVRNPEVISQSAKLFGSQCIVIAIDARFINNEWTVYIDGGRTITPLRAVEWAVRAEKSGAGEILLTSMDADGTRSGFSIGITRLVAENVNIPVIASGGAGSMEHFAEVFYKTGCSGALAAGIFHFGEIAIPELKEYLLKKGISVRI